MLSMIAEYARAMHWMQFRRAITADALPIHWRQTCTHSANEGYDTGVPAIGGAVMRRVWIVVIPLLVACSRGSSPSPTANGEATTTRSAEQTQVSAVLTPAANASAARPTSAAASPGALFPSPQSTRPPGGPAASGPAPAAAATSPAASASATGPVVKVTADDGANVRDKPDTSGQVIAKADYGAELPALDANVTGADGTSKWVKVTIQGQTGFVRSDLVAGPQAPSPPRPPAAPGPAGSPAPATATAKP